MLHSRFRPDYCSSIERLNLQNFHRAATAAVLDVINVSRHPDDTLKLSDRELAVSALALDGDLPPEFLDLPSNPSEEDVAAMWTVLQKQAIVQKGERRTERRKGVQLKC